VAKVALLERGLTKPIIGSRRETRTISARAPGLTTTSEFNSSRSMPLRTASSMARLEVRTNPRLAALLSIRQGN